MTASYAEKYTSTVPVIRPLCLAKFDVVSPQQHPAAQQHRPGGTANVNPAATRLLLHRTKEVAGDNLLATSRKASSGGLTIIYLKGGRAKAAHYYHYMPIVRSGQPGAGDCRKDGLAPVGHAAGAPNSQRCLAGLTPCAEQSAEALKRTCPSAVALGPVGGGVTVSSNPGTPRSPCPTPCCLQSLH